jgi:hypothetical protein
VALTKGYAMDLGPFVLRYIYKVLRECQFKSEQHLLWWNKTYIVLFGGYGYGMWSAPMSSVMCSKP